MAYSRCRAHDGCSAVLLAAQGCLVPSAGLWQHLLAHGGCRTHISFDLTISPSPCRWLRDRLNNQRSKQRRLQYHTIWDWWAGHYLRCATFGCLQHFVADCSLPCLSLALFMESTVVSPLNLTLAAARGALQLITSAPAGCTCIPWHAVPK